MYMQKTVKKCGPNYVCQGGEKKLGQHYFAEKTRQKRSKIFNLSKKC